MLSQPMRMSRPSPAHSRGRRLLVSLSATLLTALLIAFHAVLLWQRVLDLSLFKPVPAIRWLATAALLIGLYRLRRRGVSPLRGRTAIVLWLLVLLLHVSFWGPLPAATSTFEDWAAGGLLLALPAILDRLRNHLPVDSEAAGAGTRECRISRASPMSRLSRDSQSYATTSWLSAPSFPADRLQLFS